MARQWVTDELWNETAPLLPAESPKPRGGRPRVPERKCLVGIVFVLRTGCAWNDLPAELGCGDGSTCWRRLRQWTEAGVWPAVWQRVLNALGKQERVDLSRAVIDSASVRAVFWGAHTGPNPTDRGKRGIKRHLVVDAGGLPLSLITTPANVPDGKVAIELPDAIAHIQGPQGRPRFRPGVFQGDRGHGWDENICATRKRGVRPQLARPKDDTHGSGLGRTRWVVESTLSWFNHHRNRPSISPPSHARHGAWSGCRRGPALES